MLNINIHIKQEYTLIGKNHTINDTESNKTKGLKEVIKSPIVLLCRLVGKALSA